jgi:hypothetical protein
MVLLVKIDRQLDYQESNIQLSEDKLQLCFNFSEVKIDKV